MRPKSEIYTPKRVDEHPTPFICGVPPGQYCLNYRMHFVRIIEWIFLELSNEFCSNHLMNILWNVYCLNCFMNVGENRKHIKANLWNFATSWSNVLNKIKYIWILLAICGNYQTHIRDIEYWHISATIVFTNPTPPPPCWFHCSRLWDGKH